jgi:hypothetical protein
MVASETPPRTQLVFPVGLLAVCMLGTASRECGQLGSQADNEV